MRQNKKDRLARRVARQKNRTLRSTDLRNKRRDLDPSGFTRRQAQAFIASTSNPDEVARFAKHPSAHIQRYVAHKIALLTGVECDKEQAA